MILHNVFTFSAEVWGTVSDWVIIAVTGISLYYLRKTLQSQLEVQQMQQQLADYEKYNFLKSIRPSFTGTAKKIGDDLLNIDYICENADALETFINLYDIENFEIFRNYTAVTRIEPNKNLLLTLINETKFPNFYMIRCMIYYKDIEGRTYGQGTIISSDSEGNPEMIILPAGLIPIDEYNNCEANGIENIK